MIELIKTVFQKAVLKINQFFSSGHPRSKNLKKNIGASFVLKATSIVLSLIRIPILLSYLDVSKYGVWLTIASILEWIHIFDLGLGHGLRNRFAEAIALNEKERAKGLISTAYISMSAIMLSVLLVLLPIVWFMDWRAILNVDGISGSELRNAVVLVTIVFVTRFIFQLVTVILKALQKPALSDVFLPISGIISICLIPVMKLFISDSLFWACAIIAIPPALVLIIANLLFFRKRYNIYRPSLRKFDKKYLSDIYSLGWKFFIGQITALVLFSSSNLIIARAINPEEVTVYNIAKKYFSLPISYYMIIVTPYWSAVTDAYYRNEFEWIKASMKKLHRISLVFALGLMIMLAFSRYAFTLWVGSKVVVPFKLSLTLALYNILVLYFAPYSQFLNGFGKLKLGSYVAVIKMFLFIPVAWFLTLRYGTMGIAIALLLVNLIPNMFIDLKQYRLLVTNKAKGIWGQ